MFHRKTPVLESLLNKTPTQVFSCEICEIFKNTYFYRTPPVSSSIFSVISTMIGFYLKIMLIFRISYSTAFVKIMLLGTAEKVSKHSSQNQFFKWSCMSDSENLSNTVFITNIFWRLSEVFGILIFQKIKSVFKKV